MRAILDSVRRAQQQNGVGIMALAHDVSRELRGKHGEWTKGGDALRKMTGEAAKTASEKPKQGDRVKYKTGSLGTVHHVDDKGKIHVVWDKGRGKPVATPAHHLTTAETASKKSAGAEKAARDRLSKLPPIQTPAQIEADLKRQATEKAAREVTGAKPASLEDRAKAEQALREQQRLERVAKQRQAEQRQLETFRGGYKPPRQAGSRGGVPAPTTGRPALSSGHRWSEFRLSRKPRWKPRTRLLAAAELPGIPGQWFVVPRRPEVLLRLRLHSGLPRPRGKGWPCRWCGDIAGNH